MMKRWCIHTYTYIHKLNHSQNDKIYGCCDLLSAPVVVKISGLSSQYLSANFSIILSIFWASPGSLKLQRNCLSADTISMSCSSCIHTKAWSTAKLNSSLCDKSNINITTSQRLRVKDTYRLSILCYTVSTDRCCWAGQQMQNNAICSQLFYYITSILKGRHTFKQSDIKFPVDWKNLLGAAWKFQIL